MTKRNRPYKQGVIISETNEFLKKGQIVEIIEEHDDYFSIRVFLTGKLEKIKKEELTIN